MHPNLEAYPMNGPLAYNDMLVVMKVHCLMCGGTFACGEHWCAVPQGPLDDIEAKKAEQGLPHRRMCRPVHYDCVVYRLVELMNWRRRYGEA